MCVGAEYAAIVRKRTYHPKFALETFVTTPDPKSANDLATERTDLAARRTVMAAERTLMAWVRTGLSMISFGFTIYKVLQAFKEAGSILPNEHSPRRIGLFLTGLGTVSVVIGTIEYWQSFRDLKGEYDVRIWRPAFIMALVMSAAGLFLFLGIISKLL
jgi:putative membrane protein